MLIIWGDNSNKHFQKTIFFQGDLFFILTNKVTHQSMFHCIMKENMENNVTVPLNDQRHDIFL